MERYFPLYVEHKSLPNIKNELLSVRHSIVSIGRHIHNNISIQRSRSEIHGDDKEYYVFLFQNEGNGRLHRKGGDTELSAGTVCLFNSSEPHTYETGDYAENLTITIPCDILRTRVRGIDDCTGDADFANPMLVPVVRTLAAQFLKFDIRGTSENLERALIDLVTLMVETPHAVPMDLPSRNSLATLMFERVMDFMSVHFADPGLSPKTVASSLRISTSYVHKLFRAHGRTFEQTLLEIRLAEAHRLLTAPVAARKTPSICDIAFACGFNSQSHFSTRFRDHFGTTPRSVVSNGPLRHADHPILPKRSE